MHLRHESMMEDFRNEAIWMLMAAAVYRYRFPKTHDGGEL